MRAGLVDGLDQLVDRADRIRRDRALRCRAGTVRAASQARCGPAAVASARRPPAQNPGGPSTVSISLRAVFLRAVFLRGASLAASGTVSAGFSADNPVGLGDVACAGNSVGRGVPGGGTVRASADSPASDQREFCGLIFHSTCVHCCAFGGPHQRDVRADRDRLADRGQHRQIGVAVGVGEALAQIDAVQSGVVVQPGGPRLPDQRRPGQDSRCSGPWRRRPDRRPRSRRTAARSGRVSGRMQPVIRIVV